MIGGAATEEARAAVRLFLNDGAARRDGGRAERIGGAENRDDGQADRRGHVHGAGIVADEEMALRQERWEIGDRGFPGEDRLAGVRMAAVMAEDTAISAAVPNKIISASDSATKRFATSAKRSGGQHFAEP